MPDINLLQTQSRDIGSQASSLAKAFARILVLLVFLAIIAYGLLFYLSWSTQASINTVANNIKAKQAEIVANEDRDELLTRQEQLNELETLIDDHLYWSYLMPELARVTLSSAHYTSIEAKSDGKLNLVVSLPTYDDVEKYLQIFDLPEYNQQFSNVRVISINKVQSETTVGVQLTIQLTFNPAFIKGLI